MIVLVATSIPPITILVLLGIFVPETIKPSTKSVTLLRVIVLAVLLTIVFVATGI